MIGPDRLETFLRENALPRSFREQAERLHLALAEHIERLARAARGLVVGICGPQGCGKSTFAELAALGLADRGLRAAVLSIDDLYLTRAERAHLAAHVHPLLMTRGPPGTHDVALGLEVLAALASSRALKIPRFDKAADERRPAGEWDRFEGPADVVLFEGWCVGARPQSPEALIAPVNALERERDPNGAWRTYVNAQLAGPYQDLFGRIGLLILFQAPSFETVIRWRLEQEHKLRARLAASGQGYDRAMDDDQVLTFMQHYERLTRHIAREAPQRADVRVDLDANRRPQRIEFRAP